MKEFGFSNTSDEDSGISSIRSRKVYTSSGRSSSLHHQRRHRDEAETIEEAFSKQLALLRSTSSPFNNDKNVYEPSAFRPERRGAGYRENFRPENSLTQGFRPPVNTYSDMSSSNDEELRPTIRPHHPLRLRPTSGHRSTGTTFTNGPILSSIEDRDARRRPAPIRRSTVASAPEEIVDSNYFLKQPKKTSLASSPGDFFVDSFVKTGSHKPEEAILISGGLSGVTSRGLSDTFKVSRASRKVSGISTDEGFFSYIAPSEGDDDQRHRERKQLAPPRAIRSRVKPVQSKELEISEIDDLDLKDTGRLVVSRPFGHVGGMKGVPISVEAATDLKMLLFGNASRDFPAGWKGQAFEFNNRPTLKFGLVQHRGGPCGILATVQAFLIKALVFKENETGENDDDLEPQFDCNLDAKVFSAVDAIHHDALTDAICQILSKCANHSGDSKVVIALPGPRPNFQGFPGKYKADGVTETLMIFQFESNEDGHFSNLHEFVEYHLPFFTGEGNSAVISLLYSAILTRGLDSLREEDMDSSEVPLMGSHGYCSQEMVNLFLTGRATSNTFDGEKSFDSLVLRGIREKVDVGLLSLFEHYGSCVVGDFLKNPTYPIWLICSESHFTVIFSLQRGAEKTSTADRKIVELIYYDGMGRQDEPIFIHIDCMDQNFGGKIGLSKDQISPIEHCLKTKWSDANIFWKNCEPIL